MHMVLYTGNHSNIANMTSQFSCKGEFDSKRSLSSYLMFQSLCNYKRNTPLTFPLGHCIAVLTIFQYNMIPLMCRSVEQFVHHSPQHINLKAGNGFTALHYAALNNHGDIVALLANLVSLPCSGVLICT